MSTIEAPLLLARLDGVDRPGRVLAAVDLTATSRTIVNWAGAMAGKGALMVVHVYEAPFADRLRGYGVSKKAIDVCAQGHTDQQAADALNALGYRNWQQHIARQSGRHARVNQDDKGSRGV